MYHAVELAEIKLALGDCDTAIGIAESFGQSEAVTRDPLSRCYYRRSLAQFYAQAGRNEEAIALLSGLLKVSGTLGGGVTPYMLRLNSDWDPLRPDPRFQALLKQYPATVSAIEGRKELP